MTSSIGALLRFAVQQQASDLHLSAPRRTPIA
jgi:hypothetical protein